jgi:hypothetical protein
MVSSNAYPSYGDFNLYKVRGSRDRFWYVGHKSFESPLTLEDVAFFNTDNTGECFNSITGGISSCGGLDGLITIPTDLQLVPSWSSESVLSWQSDSFVECPVGYIMVDPNPEVGTNDSFCVAAYEMKNDAGNPVSRPEGLPWVNLNHADAKAACVSLGTDYDLISNPEWMTIAREIELVDENWTSGMSGSGSLFRGHSDNTPASALEAPGISTYRDPYFETGDNESVGQEQKRYHLLSSRNKIWDFSGNVAELVDWIVDGAEKAYYSFDTEPVSNWRNLELIDANIGVGNIMNVQTWQPDIALSTNIPGRYFAGAVGSAGVAVRGGAFNFGENAGIYSLNLNFLPTASNATIGFRCVYRP